MARKQKIPTLEDIKTQFDKSYSFNQQIGLYDTVKVNEDFFIGNQWEGVESNNLPTPTFNFLKQVVLFQVSTITSDNMALQATPLASTVPYTKAQLESITDIITQQFAAILERNRIVTKTREFLRNAAVEQPFGMQLPEQTFMQDFDFSTIRQVRMGIKQDVGASSYWSEMASMQTMDNLLINNLITPEQYVERLPSGYITKREELLAELRSARMGGMGGQNTGTGMSRDTTSGDMPVPAGGGNGALQRALNREGV